MINHYILSSNLMWLTTLTLTSFVFLSGRKSPIINAFCLFMLNVFLWSFCWSRLAMATNPTGGNFWAHAVHVGASIIPFTFYRFAMIFNSDATYKSWKPATWMGYGLMGFFLLLSYSKLFVDGVAAVSNLPFYPTPGPIYIPFIAYFGLYSLFAFILLIKAIGENSSAKKTQLRYVLIAYIVAWTGGCPAFLPVFGYEMSPYAFYRVILCIFILSYAVLAHRLLELNVMLKRISVIFFIYFFLLVLAVGAAIPAAEHLMKGIPPMHVVVVFGIGTGFIFSLGPVIYAFLVRHSYWLKTQQSTGLTHELKSPLGAIQGAARFLLDNVSSGNLDREKTESYVRMIDQNANRLEGFVKDLLNLAKIQEGDISLNRANMDLNVLIEKVIANHEPTLKQKGLEVQYSNNVEIPAYLDIEKIEQVLSNILVNAIKFSEKGIIAISTVRSKREVTITITDSGAGIPKTDLTKIFDRFYQGKRANKGSGIGLSIAKAWVEAHGGKIWAESEGEGKGATVAFTLST